ncbi:MAG: anti-sigma factor family protein [Planctomycetota bacterium]|jgi:hypothetical protein
MTDASDKPLDCRVVRDELPALLYDDLDAELERRVEQHLQSCEACRAELEGHRRTIQLLDTWSVDSARLPELTALPGWRRRRVLGWLRPVLTGAAAALVVFAVLGLLRSDVQYADGRLTVTIGGRSSPTPSRVDDPGSIVPAVRAVARDEVDARFAALLEALEVGFVKFGELEEQRRMLLARAVDLRRDEDRRQQTAVLQALTDRLEAEAIWTHQALGDIRTWIAMNDQTPAVNDDLNRKEKS